MNKFMKQFLFIILLLCCSVSIHAEDDDLITQQITVTLSEAGTLRDKIEDSEKYKITNLKIIGEINGSDVQLIRDMGGVDYNDHNTGGKLAILDLSEARIVKGGDYYKDKINNDRFYAKDNVLGDYFFYGCRSLTGITIPNSVTSIEYRAFENCSGLTNVIIPQSVTSIDHFAFGNCSGLERIMWLPNTPPSGYPISGGIVHYALNDSYSKANINVVTYPNLSSVFEVDSIMYLPNPAERTCVALYYTGSNTTTNIKMNNTVEYKGIEMTVKEIGPYFRYGNKYVKEVVVPNVEKIGDYAFTGCSSIESLTLGSNLKSIGSEALSSCTALTRLTVKAEVPPTCGSQALVDINKWTCTLCVPAAHIEEYKAADQWKDFFFYDTIETGMESASADKAIEVERFSLDGQRLTAPTKGLNIVKYSDGSVRKVAVP